MAIIEKRIEDMGITLPDSPQPIANYVPAVQTGNLLFVAGLGSGGARGRHDAQAARWART